MELPKIEDTSNILMVMLYIRQLIVAVLVFLVGAFLLFSVVPRTLQAQPFSILTQATAFAILLAGLVFVQYPLEALLRLLALLPEGILFAYFSVVSLRTTVISAFPIAFGLVLLFTARPELVQEPSYFQYVGASAFLALLITLFQFSLYSIRVMPNLRKQAKGKVINQKPI